jgi:pimeloyl-ACP methyl ester carboxylesterase
MTWCSSRRRAQLPVLVTKAIVAMLVMAVGAIGALATASGTVAGFRLTSEPVYASAPCPDPNIPELGPGANLSTAFTCGYLTVPEHRANPDGRTIRIAVARVPAATATPRPDPIVYLTGGPGGIAFLDALQAVASGMNADREVIFVAQRGTYHADPFLACPEYDEYLNDSLGLHFADPATGELDEASVRACRDRLAQTGVDFSAYNSAENAADIADLRVALGIAEWNVYGVSYGTDLAQWLLRDRPEGIRGVVLDSVVPIDQNIIEAWWPAAAMGYRTIFAACAAQPACAGAYPDLEAEFTATVTRLNDESLIVETTNAAGEPTVVNIDGYTFANLIVQQSYLGASGFAAVPGLIHDLARGDGHSAAASLLSRTAPPGLVGYGLGFGAYCREMVAQTTPEEVAAAAKEALPDFPAEVLLFIPVSGRIFEDCAIWDAGAAAADELRPVESDVPVLIMGGTFDMVTPFAWAERVAAGLENAQVVAIPGGGHGLVTKVPCAQALMTAFLDDSDAPLDATCATDLTLPTFTTP